ncbi:hypothetical protein OHA40_28880 [Nocardia sp. NBC_00508]|uniref:hypothetical protein n=1 Tax=Nocardia sp. NBC_00508 TaxID=2975992 RepID=UPI002E800CE2|nr:hypothetical protein [Nocardia sp. NBC_00508]WUD65590.1 hypothetical protein OHA40_28880 [Nocardia sp. NBC_00508]
MGCHDDDFGDDFAALLHHVRAKDELVTESDKRLTQHAPAVRLSEVRQWATSDETPYGPLSRVRCPDTQHCLRLAPFEDGRIGPHDRNIPGPCEWVDAEVLDDRQAIPRDFLITVGSTTGFDRKRLPRERRRLE